MPKEDIVSDGSVNLGTETWNVADSFVKLKVFKPMLECDRCEIVALYGYENIEEQIPPEMIPAKRIEALYRLKDNLKIVFGNANFIIRKDDRKEFVNLKKHLDFIENIIPAIARQEENQVTHQTRTTINEAHFTKCLNALRKIKQDLNTPLNSCGLIFRQTDEMTFQELLDDIAEGG